jgi:hypothetical protein
LIDDASFTYLDLINPGEAYPSGVAVVDPLDEPLLTNDVVLVSEPTDNVYTGHFLRKPQLMSNDLFTEGGRKMGNSTFVMPSASRTIDSFVNDSYDQVRKIDAEYASGGSIYNSITKMVSRPRRILSVIPDATSGSLVQFKFDEKGIDSGLLNLVLSKHFGMFESQTGEGIQLPKVFKKKRKYTQANKGSQSGGDGFHLLTIPCDDSDVCHIRSVGKKILLKREGVTGPVDETELVLINGA